MPRYQVEFSVAVVVEGDNKYDAEAKARELLRANWLDYEEAVDNDAMVIVEVDEDGNPKDL